MIKRSVALLGITILVISLRTDALAQKAIDATGNWSITPKGEPFANGQVKVRQDGTAVAGTYSPSGHFEGKFQPGTLQVDATWSDPRGTGWMTIVFAASGKSFSGQWGRPGSNPSGHFEAVRFAYPNVSGLFYVNVTGGTEMTARRISLHQLGLDVVGNLGPGTQLDGTIDSDTNTLTGNWKEPNGSGWIKLKFADDGKSFAGTWGLAPGAESAGEINGGVVNTSQLHVRRDLGNCLQRRRVYRQCSEAHATGREDNRQLQGWAPARNARARFGIAKRHLERRARDRSRRA